MNALGLDLVELLEIVRVCGSTDLGRWPAPDLNDFLAANLAASQPGLSAKVRRLDEDQMDVLCQSVDRLRTALDRGRREAVSLAG